MQLLKLPRPVFRERPEKDDSIPRDVGLGPGRGASGPTPTLEVAHVLFMDVIGYSKLRMNQQAAIVLELQELVQKSAEVQKARAESKLIIRPTGDGMALLFLRNLLSPVRCALEIQILLQKEATAIRSRVGAPISLRMGIHTGSVLLVEDLNAQSEVAGDGIILAQRVMDCGDAGHILLSSDIAERLIKIDPWSRYLKDLGICQVKHGISVHLYNLSGRFEGYPCGNSALPRKVSEERAAIAQAEAARRASFLERHPGVRLLLVAATVLGIVGGGSYLLYSNVSSVRQTVTQLLNGRSDKPLPKPSAKPTGKIKTAQARTKRSPLPGRSPRVSEEQSAEDSALTIEVPEVVGQSLSDAQQTALASGLKIRRSPQSDFSEYARGYIYQQSPPPGSGIHKGGIVYVRVSKGEKGDISELNAEKIQAAEEKLDGSSSSGSTSP